MTDLTCEEHRTLAQTCQLAGSICAAVSLALAFLCLGKLLAGQWEATLGLVVAGWLLAAANTQFRDADQHNSHAAKETPA